MKKIIASGFILALLPLMIFGQGKYMTNNGSISFFSHTALENITADNNEVACVIDASTGEVVIILKMTAFHFEKKLMEEHFNENYVESEKYPKATFKGKITNNKALDYTSQGIYKVNVEGELTIHDKTNPVSAAGTIEVTAEGITARTKFLLNPEDYDIKVPKVVRNNIAKNMEISVELPCTPV